MKNQLGPTALGPGGEYWHKNTAKKVQENDAKSIHKSDKVATQHQIQMLLGYRQK